MAISPLTNWVVLKYKKLPSPFPFIFKRLWRAAKPNKVLRPEWIMPKSIRGELFAHSLFEGISDFVNSDSCFAYKFRVIHFILIFAYAS